MQFSPTQMRIARLRAEASYVINAFRVNVNYDTQQGKWFHIERLPLPSGWNNPTADILIDIPYGDPGYPQVAPEWFWTNWNLATKNGRSISHFFKIGQQGVDQQHWDKGWGHFCLHLESWRPRTGVEFDRGDYLVTYLQVIMQVFHDQKTLAQ